MKEKFEVVKAWIMSNKLIAAVAGFVVLFFLYKKFGRKTYRRRKRPVLRSANRTSRRRSVNTVIKSGVNRGKKAWQIKGSEAARRHMAQIRRKRSRKLL